MYVTLRQLTYFQALAKEGNFGRAALACRVSQPALSMQIKEMEAELGAALVERKARQVVLTPFGRRILDHADGETGIVLHHRTAEDDFLRPHTPHRFVDLRSIRKAA